MLPLIQVQYYEIERASTSTMLVVIEQCSCLIVDLIADEKIMMTKRRKREEREERRRTPAPASCRPAVGRSCKKLKQVGYCS